MTKEARVLVKLVTHSLFLGQHFTNVIRDQVCFTYALMIGMALNYGSILRMAMRKAKSHKGSKYIFGALLLNCVV